jgi:hypothetical protein
VLVEKATKVAMNLSAPAQGSASRTGATLYAVPVTAGALYTVAITGLDNDADLYVFNDEDLARLGACMLDNRLLTGTRPEDCSMTAESSTLYIVVDGMFSSQPEVRFIVYASPAPAAAAPVNQGTANAPHAVGVHALAVGQVAAGGASWYAASGLAAGRQHTVSISGLRENADLKVFRDSSFTTTADCSVANTSDETTRPESCTLVTDSGTLYFSVAADTAATPYLLLVEPVQ